MRSKLLKNALIGESMQKFSRIEKHDIVKELLKRENISQRELAKRLGIPHSTVHDWASLRQDNKGVNAHLSLSRMVYYFKHLEVESFNDWGRIAQIKELCEDLLSRKN